MITKHNDWELGAYLYEYNGDPIASVNFNSPITLLSKTFFTNLTKYYINEKFFYYDLSKDTYFLKTDVEFILRFFIRLKTDNNNLIYSQLGYYANPLQVKVRALPDIIVTTTANTQLDYKTSVFPNIPTWIATKNDSFFLATNGPDTVTFINNAYGFLWTVMLRQI